MFAGTLLQYVKPDAGTTTWPSPADVEPYVAESVTQIEDGYRFVLRDDAVSPYGNTVTSEDVRWTFDRIIALDRVGRFLLSWGGGINLEEPIRVIDDRTFDLVVLDTNNPYSLAVLTYGQMGPLDSIEVLSHATDDDPWGAEWLSTNSAGFGSYRLDSITPGEELRLVPNPNWWGSSPDIDLIVIRAIPDAAGRLQLLQAGEVDFADKLTLAQFASVGGDLQAIPAKGNTTVPLVLNSSFEPFADVRVRQAISSAIDRTALVQGPMQGSAKEALYQVLSEVPQPPPPGDPAILRPGPGPGAARRGRLRRRFGVHPHDQPGPPRAVLGGPGRPHEGPTRGCGHRHEHRGHGVLRRLPDEAVGGSTPGLALVADPWHQRPAVRLAAGAPLRPRHSRTPTATATPASMNSSTSWRSRRTAPSAMPWCSRRIRSSSTRCRGSRLIELVNPISLGPDVESFRMDIFRRIIPEELAKN